MSGPGSRYSTTLAQHALSLDLDCACQLNVTTAPIQSGSARFELFLCVADTASLTRSASMHDFQKVCSPNCKTVCDMLSIQDTMNCVFSSLSVVDTLRFASTSKQCQQLVCPASLDLNINSCKDLRVLSALNRRGCLQQLQQARVKASIGDAIAGAYLGLLGSCSSQRQLELVFKFDERLLSLSVFIGDRESAAQVSMRQVAEAENLISLKEAMPINVRSTVRMLEECNGDQWCSYVESGEDPPCGRCDCRDRKWERAPWESNAACFFGND